MRQDCEAIYDYQTKVPEVGKLFSEKSVLDKILKNGKDKNTINFSKMSKQAKIQSKVLQKEHEDHVKVFKQKYLTQKKNLEIE